MQVVFKTLAVIAYVVFWSAAFVWVFIQLENGKGRVMKQKPDHLNIDGDQSTDQGAQKES